MKQLALLFAFAVVSGCQSMPPPVRPMAGTVRGSTGGTADFINEIRGTPERGSTRTTRQPFPDPPAQKPVTVPAVSLANIQDAYSAFEYEETNRNATAFVRQPGVSARDRAIAHFYAGAASYIQGNTEAMDRHLLRSIEADRSVSPNRGYFPRAVCDRHQALMRNH